MTKPKKRSYGELSDEIKSKIVADLDNYIYYKIKYDLDTIQTLFITSLLKYITVKEFYQFRQPTRREISKVYPITRSNKYSHYYGKKITR